MRCGRRPAAGGRRKAEGGRRKAEGESRQGFFTLEELKAGNSAPEELATATQVQGPYMPIAHEKPLVELVKVTDEMKSFKAYATLGVERTNQRQVGARLRKAAEAEKEEKK
ncbi:hypothetical protein BHM03_00022013 [Ensete ventricosum]|nr:hypothetical protein BHM03_00022013 [Ensete ventricosum]